jgi:hypothetical protein
MSIGAQERCLPSEAARQCYDRMSAGGLEMRIPAPVHTALADFLSPFSVTVDGSTAGDDAGSLTVDANVPLPASDRRQWRLRIVLTHPELSAQAREAVSRRFTGQGSFDANLKTLDDVVGSLTYAFSNRRFGRSIESHRSMFAVLTEAEGRRAESSNAEASAVNAALLRDFGTLLGNQPQLFVTGEYHRRRDLIGPREWSTRLTWETGSQNLNGFYRGEGHECSTGEEACLAAFQRYASRTLHSRAAGRLALSLVLIRSNETGVNLDMPYAIASTRSIVYSATYGRPVASLRPGKKSWLDVAMVVNGTYGTDAANADPAIQTLAPLRTRLLLAATYTQTVTNHLSIPVSVFFTDRVQDLPGLPVIISPSIAPAPEHTHESAIAAHIGISYRVSSAHHGSEASQAGSSIEALTRTIREALKKLTRSANQGSEARPAGLSTEALTRTIREALKKLIRDVEAMRAGLHPFSCGTTTCYPVAEVDRADAAIQRGIRDAIPSEALPLEMALLVETQRPASPLTIGAKVAPPAIQYVRMPPSAPERGYDAQETDSWFQRVLRNLYAAVSYASYTPSVEFRSDPDGAAYEIQIANTKITRHTGNTNQREPEVWRGFYTGTVQKAGYKSAPLEINLMNDKPRVTCKCTLYKTTAPPEDESICRLE